MNTAGPVIRARCLENEEYFLAAWDRNPKKPRVWVLLLIAFSIGCLLLLPDTLKARAKRLSSWWVAPAVIVLAGAFVTWSASPLRLRQRFRKHIRKRLASSTTEAWFEFSEAGFMSTGQGGTNAFHPWATVPKVQQLADGLLIFFDEELYCWIPQQAFASAEDYASVTKVAQNKAKLFQQSTG